MEGVYLLFIFLQLLVGGLSEIDTHHISHENKPGFLFDSSQPTFSIPLTINVALVGFNGDGNKEVVLPTTEFAQTLENSMEACVPVSIETEQGIPVQFELSYSVFHAAEDVVRQYEQWVTPELRDTGLYDGDQKVFEAEITRFEPKLLSIIDKLSDPKAKEALKTYTVLLINPDLARLRPPSLPMNGGYVYRYRYNGATPSQTWIGKGRYIALDLTAGPCSFGVTDSGEGTVAADTIPSLGDVEKGTEPSVKFRAQLSSTVITAVRHVFLSDLQFSDVKMSQRLIVPIITLRNHRRFDPLDPDITQGPEAGALGEFYIDMQVIKQQVRSMLLPEQDIMFFPATHSVYEHNALSKAVFKALRGETVHTIGLTGAFHAKTVDYFDGKILLEEVKKSATLFVATLIERANVFSPQIFKSRAGELDDSEVGIRILPVFIFSLLGLSPETLIDHQHLVIADPEVVIVLQTGANKIPLPFFDEDGIVHANARSVTRHIIAGISIALAGITPPFNNFNLEKHQLQHDYLWATGHHPFGPFTKTPNISQIYLDLIVRNSMLSRINQAITMVRDSVAKVDEFSLRFVRDGFGEDVQYKTVEAPQTSSRRGSNDEASFTSTNPLSLINLFNAQPGSNLRSPLTATIAKRLFTLLLQIEDQFREMEKLLRDHKLNEANKMSVFIRDLARAFSVYVDGELESVEEDFTCCKKEYHLNTPTSRGSTLLKFLFPITLAILGLACAFFCRKRTTPEAPKARQRYQFPSTSLGQN